MLSWRDQIRCTLLSTGLMKVGGGRAAWALGGGGMCWVLSWRATIKSGPRCWSPWGSQGRDNLN